MSLRHKASTPAAPRGVQLPNLTGVGVVMNQNDTGRRPYTTSRSKDDAEWRSDIKEILHLFKSKAGTVQLQVEDKETGNSDKLTFSISVGGEPKMVSLFDDVGGLVLFQVFFDGGVVKFVELLEAHIRKQKITLSNIAFLTFL